jgi:hypothetical protein
MKKQLCCASAAFALAFASLAGPADAADFAVWLGGVTTPGGGGNGIVTSLDHAFGPGSYQLVTTANLETAGFLNGFKTVIVSRFDSQFGGSLSAAAAANVKAYVGTGATAGGVAVFTNAASDNFFGAKTNDVFDPNLDQLFVNAATYARLSGHGYIGEFNGAVMAMESNTAGFASLGLLQGSAGGLHSYGSPFAYDVGPIGGGHPIDAGVTFPFTDSDTSTFLTDVTGADPDNVVAVYTSRGIVGRPAVLANAFVINGGVVPPAGVPEPATWTTMLLGLFGLGGVIRRRRSSHAVTAGCAV